MLDIQNLNAGYGPSQVLFNLSMDVQKKEIVSIIGRNGVGKTSTLKAVMGLIHFVSGAIRFDSKEISGLPTYRRGRLGIGYVPDDRGIFVNVTTAENLRIPLIGHRMKTGDNLDLVFSLFPILKERVKQKAETLSGGQQQMLAVGRALMSNPKLLALDEPSLGLSPILVSEMMRTLKRICDEWKVSLLLVEQNARAALKIADYVYLLERGQVALSGMCREVISNPTIQRAYLGG